MELMSKPRRHSRKAGNLCATEQNQPWGTVWQKKIWDNVHTWLLVTIIGLQLRYIINYSNIGKSIQVERIDLGPNDFKTDEKNQATINIL